jgi:hypothetical protein
LDQNLIAPPRHTIQCMQKCAACKAADGRWTFRWETQIPLRDMNETCSNQNLLLIIVCFKTGYTWYSFSCPKIMCKHAYHLISSVSSFSLFLTFHLNVLNVVHESLVNSILHLEKVHQTLKPSVAKTSNWKSARHLFIFLSHIFSAKQLILNSIGKRQWTNTRTFRCSIAARLKPSLSFSWQKFNHQLVNDTPQVALFFLSYHR